MSTENLNRDEALKKMKGMAEDIKVAMMITGFSKKPLNAIPMTTKKVDDNGNIWFLSGASSEHNTNLVKEKEIQLLYSDPSDMEYLSVYGRAEVVRDKEVLKDLYSKMDNNWFDGANDPELTAIKVIPENAYYWDNKTNKYISFLKLGVGALTGDRKDVGEKGKLKL